MPDTAARPPLVFRSILFRDIADRPADRLGAPEYFRDLNLDQIVGAVTAGYEEYDLKPFFHAKLRDIDSIAFRHEIMRDLENPDLFEDVRLFAQGLRLVREHLARAEKLRHPLQQQRWFLDAALIYCAAVLRLVDGLSARGFSSRGLCAFHRYAADYANSPDFAALHDEARRLAAAISEAGYAILIQGPRVDVRLYEGEPDYSAEVLATFERFSQGGGQKYKFDFAESLEVNHIEGQILDRVALLYPELFAALAAYCTENAAFQDPTIVTFDREIKFYVAYLDHIARFKKAGLSFCYPRVVEDRGEVFDERGFDLALAGRLAGEEATPVCNDFHLRDPERIVVVSGPNQGGKTTFARTFGQLHHLANLGCPVPGTRAQLYLFDRLFTHFEKGESIADLRGKLQDDLYRVHQILEAATPHSIIVMNEIFSSTALRDALMLSRKIATAIARLDAYCVWVTFIGELASLNDKTVSMTSTVVPESPAERTYRIVRRPADGLAYAMSIAEKYRLTGDAIKRRIGP